MLAVENILINSKVIFYSEKWKCDVVIDFVEISSSIIECMLDYSSFKSHFHETFYEDITYLLKLKIENSMYHNGFQYLKSNNINFVSYTVLCNSLPCISIRWE
jgi:hypothetical protein